MKKFNQRGSGLVSLLLVVMIIGVLYYFMLGPKRAQEDKKSYLQQMSVDARSYNSILESTKKAVEASQPKSVE